MTKNQLLLEVWLTCTFDEIINKGFEIGKCGALQLCEAAEEFKYKDKTEEESFIIQLRELFEEYKSKLPWGREIMEVLDDYICDDSMMDYFDNSDLINHLDGSWELENYVEDACKEAVDDYINENDITEYTFKDYTREVENLPNWKLKRYLCDLCGDNYHVSNEVLSQHLIEKIK